MSGLPYVGFVLYFPPALGQGHPRHPPHLGLRRGQEPQVRVPGKDRGATPPNGGEGKYLYDTIIVCKSNIINLSQSYKLGTVADLTF